MYKAKKLAKVKVVFTLPMRNWNSFKAEEAIEGNPSFYFTYEELKPNIEDFKLPHIPRFYFTYEELKHG